MARFADDQLFEFEKFMDADKSFHILRMCPDFATEARRESEYFFRQILFGNNFVLEESHHCHLSGTSKILVVLHFIKVIFTLREIACTHKRLTPDHRRRDMEI